LPENVEGGTRPSTRALDAVGQARTIKRRCADARKPAVTCQQERVLLGTLFVTVGDGAAVAEKGVAMSMTRIVCRAAVALAAIALLVPNVDAAPKNGRGNITAVDWNVMQIAIRGVDGKVNTFRVQRDVSVKFSAEGGERFPNPTLRDLAPPMYIWFIYEDWQGKEAPTIQNIDVREIPRGAGRTGSSPGTAPSQPGQGQDMTVRISKITNKSRGEFDADVAGRNQRFVASPPNMLSRWREGDLVIVTAQGRTVTNIRPAQQ